MKGPKVADEQGAMPEPSGETPDTTDAAAGETPDETFDPTKAKALIDKLRPFEREAKRLQKELDKIAARDLTETERLQQELKARDDELNTLRGRERERNAEAVITKAATGAIKPEAIWRMVRSDIEYDDDGQPANVKPLIESVKREFPELFHARNGSADGGNGNGSAPATDNINDYFRELAKTAR